jgi:hypothetical protein
MINYNEKEKLNFLAYLYIAFGYIGSCFATRSRYTGFSTWNFNRRLHRVTDIMYFIKKESTTAGEIGVRA